MAQDGCPVINEDQCRQVVGMVNNLPGACRRFSLFVSPMLSLGAFGAGTRASGALAETLLTDSQY
jgi:hypothetical protein